MKHPCESIPCDINPTKEPVVIPTLEPDVNPTKEPDVNPTKEPYCQGRIQDLSEGGGQDFLGTKKFIIRNKNRAAGENSFDLKYSKRVKIDDYIYLMFLSREIDVKLCQNYTKTYIC